MKYLYLTLLIFCLSCSSSDEDNYTSVSIETVADTVSVLQNQSVTISIFENDTNIAQNATLTISNPEVGSAVINTNNTPNTVLDDTIIYTANTSFTGQVEILYTICNTSSNCSTQTITITVLPFTEVNFDIAQVPYQKLSQYNFFSGNIKDLIPVAGVLPYEPISSLFSDYAHKKRFIWLSTNQKATYISDARNIEMPVGSVLIKNFFYTNVLPHNNTVNIETRLMIKKEEGWIFAEYFWNDEQTDAIIDTQGDGGFKYIEWLENGVKQQLNYRMPSGSECFTCHKNNASNEPIGIKPQSLNSTFQFADGLQNQLQKWVEVGYLEDNIPANINTVVDYTDITNPLEIRVRSYLDINCASCHRDEGHCNYRPMRFAFDENNLSENLGVCIDPDQTLNNLSQDQKLIKPGDPENSVIYHRMSSILEDVRMPLLGRRLVHQDGVTLLREWINSIETPCD